MNSKARLTELRKLIGAIDGTQTKPSRPFSLLTHGVPLSSLIEITGIGKTEFVASFLKEHRGLKTAWIEKKISINPYALWQRGVDTNSILFLECGGEAIWATQQVIGSHVFQAIVLSEIEFSEKDLRKFQLLIEKTNAHLLLLSKEVHQSWVPALQIQVSEGLNHKLLRKRASV